MRKIKIEWFKILFISLILLNTGCGGGGESGSKNGNENSSSSNSSSSSSNSTPINNHLNNTPTTNNTNSYNDISYNVDLDNCTKVNGSIVSNITWNKSCYHITEDIDIKQGAFLTISDGTTVILDKNKNIIVHGSMKAVGTETKPIIFKGKESSKGYWGSINFSNKIETSELAYSVIENGGADAQTGVGSSLKETSLYINHDALISVHDITIRNGANYGFKIEDLANISTFKKIISIDNDIAGFVTSNTFSKLDESSHFKGNKNDYIKLSGTTIIRDRNWNKIDVPIFLTPGATKILDSAFLTIAGGNKFICAKGSEIQVNGGIKIDGTANKPIIFRGEEGKAGDWYGINLNYSDDDRNEISYTTLSDGGGNDSFNSIIYLGNRSTLYIHDSTISNSAGFGIWVSSRATLTSRNNSFVNNQDMDIYRD